MSDSHRRPSARAGVAAANLAIGLAILLALAAIVWALVGLNPREGRAERLGTRYAQQAQAAGKLDPALVRWVESAGPFQVAMDWPAALALDGEDRIHVIGERLVILDADGIQVLRSAEFPEEYRALAVDASGRIFAVTARRIEILEREGEVVNATFSFELPEPNVGLSSIALTPDGIFVADAVGRRVFRFPRNLEELPEEERVGEVFAEGFNVPSVMDLTAAADGELVTVDPGRHLVQRRDSYGDVVSSFGRGGIRPEEFHGCCNPAAVAMFPDGRTATTEKGVGATRVKIFDAEGELESFVAGPDAFDERPNGPVIVLDVAVDSRGRVLVLDPSRKQARIFSPKEAADEGR